MISPRKEGEVSVPLPTFPPEDRITVEPTLEKDNWRTRNENRPKRPFQNVKAGNRSAIPGGSAEVVQSSEKVRNDGISKGPTFKRVAQVEEEADVEKVADQVLGAGVTLSVRELTGLSKGVRDEIIGHLKKKKVALSVEEVLDEELEKKTVLYAHQLPGTFSSFLAQELPEDRRAGVPDDGVVISDPVVRYHQNLLEGETPKQIIMAKESQSLRTVFPLINGTHTVESICDSGSQIVSMSEEVAKQLHLSYNPDIVVYMQSANRSSEPTLGVAENVPFSFGNITVYLQVHIIRDPAYKVLLGRPFDCLLQSVTSNYNDGSATLTLTCPQTKKRITVNTYARGTSARKDDAPFQQEDFQPSMI
jgi:hypothetical protein